MEPKKPRVLVIRGGAIGDFVLTLPAIRLIRAGIPQCHLEVLGYPGISDLAVKAGLAEAARNLEHRTMAPLFAKGAAIDEALAEYLRGFNLIVSYLYDPDGHFKASLERVGAKTVIECSHRVQPGAGHAAAQLARPLESLAMYLDDAALRQPVFVPATACGKRPLRVAIHPGSGSETKNWPLSNWLSLAVELAARPDLRVTFITGEAEAARGVTSEIQVQMRGVPHDHWDHLPLAELADRLGACSLFLGHDSGIGHLAAACGVPALILLFGPTDPSLWAPPQEAVRVVKAPGGDLARLPLADVRETVAEMLPQ